MNNENIPSIKKLLLQDRTIRVFISSTFKDMQEDRDYLVKNIFPQLRKLCESRGVTWAEIDLRWGITSEQVSERKVLPICLEEIKRCKPPYFIGLLGERYGWIPDTIPDELLEKEKWLKEQLKDKKSVTELEILHGVLNNINMENHAFFYFRDPEYVKRMPKDKQSEFISTSSEEVTKLFQLKNKIRQSGFPVQENYPSPEKLGGLILEDMTEVINVLYPEIKEEDSQNFYLDREKLDHEAYARSRANVYIGRDEYFEKLDQHAEGDDRQPVVILGESGSGKSALLANWVIKYKKEHPDDLIIQHYIGSSSYSTDWVKMLRRIMGELKRNTNIIEEIPTDSNRIRDDFPLWLINAASQRKIILIIDALNQLEDIDFSQELRWLPPNTHQNLRLFLSTLPGTSLNEIEKRGWPTFTVQTLSVPEREKLIADFLNIYSRKLEDVRVKRIANAPQSANPLYLRVLLDELRIFGIYEELDQRINHYLTAKTPIELYKLVIERWESDYGKDEHKNKTTLVADTLTMLWSARHGLSEAEMLDILGSKEKPIARAIWSPLFLSMGDALVSKGGLLNFSHDYLKKAVEVKYLLGKDQQKQARLKLAGYFDKKETGNRKADELPWLYRLAEMKDELRRTLLDIELFYIVQQNNEEELKRYWVWLGEEQKMGELYLNAYEKWSKNNVNQEKICIVAFKLGLFFSNASLISEAESLIKQSLVICERIFGKDHPWIATPLNSLAILLQDTGKFEEAEQLCNRVLEMCEKNNGKVHPNVALALDNLGRLYSTTNRLSEAELLYKQSLEICEKSCCKDKDFFNLATVLNNQAKLYCVTKRFKEAEPLYRRSLEIFEKYYGKENSNVAALLNNLSELLYNSDQFEEAETLCIRAMEICEKSFGKEHPNYATVLNSLATLMQNTNRFKEAEVFYQMALQIFEKNLVKDHPKLAIVLNNLAELYRAKNRLTEAEPLYKRALEIYEKIYGKGHPNYATVLNSLATLMQNTSRFEEAEVFYRRVLEFYEKNYGKEHPNYATVLNNLAVLFFRIEQYLEAEPLYKKAIEILFNYSRLYGKIHPSLQLFVNNYRKLLNKLNYSEDEINIILKQIAPDFYDKNSI